MHSEPNYSEAKNIFDYIGRYVQRVAISNDRIISIDDNTVCFRYKDYADDGKIKIMRLEAVEFIRRFLLHVLPKRFVKLRYYGFLGCRNRQEKLKLCRELLGITDDELFSEEIPETWKELYEFVTGNEIDQCPYCRKGKLIYVKEIPAVRVKRGP